VYNGFCFVTDQQLSRRGAESDVTAALAAGVRYIQYRRKSGSALELFREALTLRDICADALFIVNDRVDIAHAVEADGVHIGNNDLPYAAARDILGNRIIGMSASSPEQALRFQELGANYLGIGPVFATGTKADADPPIGTQMIAQIRTCVSLPLIAIGGITHANAQDVITAGADGICAISAVLAADCVSTAIRHFQENFS
jgi:thiamine-phosphate pyrophosphorylase